MKKSGIFTARVVVLMLFFIVVVPMLPLLISWRWNWWEAWAYALVSMLGYVISRWLTARRNPDLLVERARFLQLPNAEPWDKILAPLVGLGGGLIPLTAGLETRFGNPIPFPAISKTIALLAFLAGFSLGSYALVENRYFSGMVRAQTDRGQQVVSGGPYRWMRHPGYAGALLTYLATPFLLDSLWSFLPTVIISIALIIRTRLEDQFLQVKLPGYDEYTRRVRYRLLPGIW
jgi:protein-S-isoprenylcysteine O-methyltransferase Ste14